MALLVIYLDGKRNTYVFPVFLLDDSEKILDEVEELFFLFQIFQAQESSRTYLHRVDKYHPINFQKKLDLENSDLNHINNDKKDLQVQNTNRNTKVFSVPKNVLNSSPRIN